MAARVLLRRRSQRRHDHVLGQRQDALENDLDPRPPVGEHFLTGQERLRDHAARVGDQPDIIGAGDSKGSH